MILPNYNFLLLAAQFPVGENTNGRLFVEGE
jgi:hypothetical protein